jgi:hypothetical protein
MNRQAGEASLLRRHPTKNGFLCVRARPTRRVEPGAVYTIAVLPPLVFLSEMPMNRSLIAVALVAFVAVAQAQEAARPVGAGASAASAASAAVTNTGRAIKHGAQRTGAAISHGTHRAASAVRHGAHRAKAAVIPASSASAPN